jgi:type II secretory pathway pseudopilin PulG
MIVVAIIGILASIAIPVFSAYTRRAKTSEASVQLQKIYTSARAYFHDSPGGAGMTQIPPQFPGSVGLTPVATCCLGDVSRRCSPTPADWTDPTWIELNFSMLDPHYYRYQYDSSGVGNDAIFTARAFGDLDCDGTLSTFEMIGTALMGDSVGSAHVRRIRPLE